MKPNLGYSQTRHNLNSITTNKLYVPTSINTQHIEYTGTCQGCGVECPSNVTECLSCAMGNPPKGERTMRRIEILYEYDKGSGSYFFDATPENVEKVLKKLMRYRRDHVDAQVLVRGRPDETSPYWDGAEVGGVVKDPQSGKWNHWLDKQAFEVA